MIHAGTDMKFRATTNIVGFSLARNRFSISIKNRWGKLMADEDGEPMVITNENCFYDSDGNCYFTVGGLPNGQYNAFFTGYIEDDDYDTQEKRVTDKQLIVEVGDKVCDCHETCYCEQQHDIHYEMVYEINIDGETYLADKDGKYIFTSDGKRIQFK